MIAVALASAAVGALLMLWFILITLGRQSDRDARERAYRRIEQERKDRYFTFKEEPWSTETP